MHFYIVYVSFLFSSKRQVQVYKSYYLGGDSALICLKNINHGRYYNGYMFFVILLLVFIRRGVYLVLNITVMYIFGGYPLGESRVYLVSTMLLLFTSRVCIPSVGSWIDCPYTYVY